MTNPFGTAHGQVVLAAARAMNSVIIHVWPRLMAQTSHKENILHAVAICWLNMREAVLKPTPQSKELRDQIAVELQTTCKIVLSLQEDENPESHQLLLTTMKEEPELRELFCFSG